LQGQQDEYKVKWFCEALFIFSTIGCEVVMFQNQPNQPIIPLPKPEYIALHAAIVDILHETKFDYLSTIIDYFMPNSSLVLLGKFNTEDLPLRITLMQIFEPALLSCTPRILLNWLP
jgi:hypothetical protein